MAVTITEQEVKLLDSAKAQMKARAEAQAEAQAYLAKKQKQRNTYNVVIAVLLAIGTYVIVTTGI